MFSVNNNECVGFDSQWKVKGVYAQGSSQTTEYSLKDISTSTSTTAEVETQTCDASSSTSAPEGDMQKLAEWLSKVYPAVQKELNEAVQSNAFQDHYSYEESSTPDARLLQIINVVNDYGDGDNAARRVGALSWNSTGNTVAVACNHFHKSWCYHSGQVRFYTFNRDDKLPDLPQKKLRVSSCINVLRFHQTLPFIIACGTYSGEIIILNIQHDQEDSIVGKVNGHEEGVTDMMWMQDLDASKTVLLATSSVDGVLNLWNFNFLSSSFSLKQRYKIKSPVFARVQRTAEVPEEISKKVVRGILNFDFSVYKPDMFVTGIEGGLIVLCSMLGTRLLKGSTKDVPILDPVVRYYDPHEGEIIAVRFSPNRKDIFMSCATDGEIRIYLIEQETAARVIFLEKQLLHISWILYQENLIAGCGEKGTIEIYHLINGRTVPNVSSEKVLPSRLLQMDINKKRCTTVAIGNDRGELQLWTVPWGLFASQKLRR